VTASPSHRSAVLPAIAAALSAVAPGSGQALANRLQRGLALAMLSSVVALIAIAIFARVPTVVGIILPLAGVLCWRLWCASDAYRQASMLDGPVGVTRAVGHLFAFAVAAIAIDSTTYTAVRKVLSAWRLPSGSMAPALLANDYILTQPLRREPRRQDIVAFQSPMDSGQLFVKRIIAGPGDTVAMDNGQVVLNGHAISEPYAHSVKPSVDPVSDDFAWQSAYLVAPASRYQASRHTWGPLVVPPGSYFVLGDDRDNSLDSRYFGFVTRPHITGMPTRVYFSRDSAAGRVRWSRIGLTIQDP